MQLFGNIFTQYNYTTTDITVTKHEESLHIHSDHSGFEVSIDTKENETIELPAGSPFPGWKEARRYAGPLPFTFTYNVASKKVLIIEGVRENWTPAPVRVLDYRFSFLNEMNFHYMRLANAFIIKNIPYYWKKGKLEQWIT